MFGPGPSHNGLIYARTNENLALATQRLTAARKPEIPGFHQHLQRNQEDFIRDHQPFYHMLASLYSAHFDSWTDMCEMAREHHDDPHQKRMLRIQAWTEIVERGRDMVEGDEWLFTHPMWKLKLAEWSKPGKFGRTIVDLATPASLAGFLYANMLKDAMAAEVIHINGGTIVFCKSPRPSALREAFGGLFEPPGRFFFVYFSDDACLAIRNPRTGRIERYNLDIQLCDASHTGALFDTLYTISPSYTHSAVRAGITQCSAPIKLLSTQDRKIKCVIKPKSPMLYSGVTLTGGINGVANTSIALAISECDYVDGDSIRLAGERVGYVLTGWEAPLDAFEEVQFLKHSPVLDIAGDWQPVLNLGVMMRASGSCKGDLPGRGPWEPRAREFQASLMQGMYPRTHSHLIDTIKLMTGVVDPKPLPRAVAEELAFKVVDDPDEPHIYLTDDSLYRRYALNPEEISEVNDIYARMRVGQWLHSSALTKILALDYSGMATIESEDPPWHGAARFNLS